MQIPFAAAALLAFAISLSAPVGAWAQAAEEAPPGTGAAGAEAEAEPAAPTPRRRPPAGIEEIVVQAGESDAVADLQAGDSVTGFDASDLEALGAQSIEDIAGFTPNLEIVTTGSTTPTFFIRGVGLNDFNANSSGAVSIYQDDVPKNAPALQLGTLFDMEAVNVLRGPQGTGPARNASAGAIKLYSRKPSGNFGGYLRSDIGNYDARDFEGAVEMPLYQDILSSRFSFRYSERDGWMKNRCGSNPRTQKFDADGNIIEANRHRGSVTRNLALFDPDGIGGASFPSVCGERVYKQGASPDGTVDGFSIIPEGLETDLNNLGNWATRGMLRFQPTLDQDWLLTFNIAKRDQLSTVGQSIGTSKVALVCDEEIGIAQARSECQIPAFGSADGGGGGPGYLPVETVKLQNKANPCQPNTGIQDNQTTLCPGIPQNERELFANAALNEIRRDFRFDDEPYEGDYNVTGDTKNDVWGVSLKGEIAIGDSMTLTTVTGYDTYDRFNFTDLDFSPNTLFEILTDDEGWQVVQDIQLSGALSQEIPINWQIGGFTLIEELEAFTDIFLPVRVHRRAVTSRDWTQNLYSAAGYFSFDWDFWDDFTLDGGVRYNWEKKKLEMVTLGGGDRPESRTPFKLPRRPEFYDEADTWQAPTGTIRLTYRFREDTHAYWKYTRGWKGGHYNVTISSQGEITKGDPETIDSFEVGLRGSWFNGRFGVNTSLFHYAYQDYQIFTVVIPLSGTPEFQVLNASDAEVYGGELEVTARPIPGMFLEARLSWLESQFLDFKQEQFVIQTKGIEKESFKRSLDFSGNRLLNSPPFKVSLTAEQTFPLGRYGSLTARWDGAWTDETSYDASEGQGTPTFEGANVFPETTIGQPAFWLHNLRLGYRTPDGGIEVAGWVRNVTDELYKSFAFDASGVVGNETTIHFLGEPRTFGMSLTATF